MNEHIPTWLLVLGLTGQIIFGARFFIQWIASEKKRESHIPIVFWYLSMAGGLLLLVYAVIRQDPVFILGQSMGILVYSRNLILIYRTRKKQKSAAILS